MSEEATTNPTPMRLRAEPPRVTRLSRKMLAGAGAVALLGIGGALIYALQTRDMSGNGEELYSTENRATADGLAGLPKDYTGPVLGPALPGDLGGPILDAQNRGQPVTPPAMATPARDPAEERRLAEEEAARLSTVFFQSGQRWRRRLAPICRALLALTLVASPQHRTATRHF
jgi:type IV secretory pathway VirB10-like protein